MCGRYYIGKSLTYRMEEIVGEADCRIEEEQFNRDVYPTDLVPVIVAGQQGLKLTCQRWGYPGYQGKGVVFNARAESVMEKKMFHNGIRYNRAVIPAGGFYEWNQNKEKITFLRKDSPVIYLAGFYSRFEDGERFVILTTAANESMVKTHDRMPLILEEDQLEGWIRNNGMTAEILRQIPVMLGKEVDYEQQTLF
ncbi:SOS response-associated peptidase [Faecalicatena contorta]|uniref:Abasic site processing protein n=1 Tax=Faecalicatena contorta TaxID=39482 RepID=A0A315ZQU7_9FIRM|nr:putative SOS response-associated peptidase YedK [Faecalicatena contorta]SUQ15728.1 Putative SOS response-associated peptidase YedK [Faecalicatena contorta]